MLLHTFGGSHSHAIEDDHNHGKVHPKSENKCDSNSDKSNEDNLNQSP